MPCPHCNAEVAPSDVYCISCGARLTPSAAPPAAGDPTPGTLLQHGAAASGPPTASASLHPAAPRRWPLILIALLVNLLLLMGSAWLVYAALLRYAERNRPSMTLGAPRLVRVAPRPSPVPDAAPALTRAPEKAETPPAKQPEKPAASPSDPSGPSLPSKPGKSGKAARAGKAPSAPGTPAPLPSPAKASSPTSRPVPESKTAESKSGESSADEVRAGLDAESVRMVVQHHLPQVRACYDRALKQQDGLAGSVEIEFEVSADGRVRSSKVHSNTTGHDGLGRCIAGLLKTWRFPKPVGGDVVFIYPFLFSSGGE